MAAAITLIGNLGGDAEARSIPGKDGGPPIAAARMRVGVSTGYGDRKGTTWYSVEITGAPAEWCGKMRKGEAVTVIGEPCLRDYTDRDGTPRQSLDVRASVITAHTRRDDAPAPAARGGDRW